MVAVSVTFCANIWNSTVATQFIKGVKMTDMLLIFLVLLLQILTVYLDNKSNMFDFFFFVSKGTVASAFSSRGITLTISRVIFYAVPPILGYLIISTTKGEMQFLLIAAASINLAVTIIQSLIYSKRFKLSFFSELRRLSYLAKSIQFYVGILAFMLFLITPYLLNYLAVVFPRNALWLVQLNPILNAFLTLYVIWLFDPRVSKKIDQQHDYADELFEAMFVRLCGRFFIFVVIFFFIGGQYFDTF